jgi:hypothetical protein
MAQIRTLKPNVTQQEAFRTFSGGLSAALWRVRTGPLRRIADAYVPYWLYRVRYSMGGARHTRFFALDAVDGSLDLFEFPGMPAENEFLSLDTRNHPRPALDESRAAELLREKVLRVIFLQGFFKLRDTALEIRREPGELYLPYWLGFYGSSDVFRCRVMDAVRCRMEGAKASAFFEQWLARPGGLAA